MVIDTERVICKKHIFEDTAIVLRIEDNGAGNYLSIYSRNGSLENDDKRDLISISFENEQELNDFYKVAKSMLKFCKEEK